MPRHEVLLPSQVETPLGRFLLAGAIEDGGGVGPRRPLRVYGDYALVCLTGGGGAYEDANGVQRRLAAGAVVTVFPELAHWYGPQHKSGRVEPWDEVYLTFAGPAFDLWRGAGLLDPARPVCDAAPADWPARFRALIADLARPADAAGRVRQVAALQSLAADLLPPGAGLPAPDSGGAPDVSPWLARARGLLEDGLARPADLAAVAAATGVSYETFRKRFQREAGVSPARYRLAKRIEAAQRLLTYAPQMTNRQLAEAFGFSDEFHFSRRFREVTGVTPTEFRQQGRDQTAEMQRAQR
jgi:AraC-like DNA-binding protein